jgi:hypothetical protein
MDAADGSLGGAESQGAGEAHRRFPDVGWEICIEQIKPGSRFGFTTATDPAGAATHPGPGKALHAERGTTSTERLLIF